MDKHELSLSEAIAALTRELDRSLDAGGGSVVEADPRLNAASRAVIEAMRRAHGEAWLGKVNPPMVGAENAPRLWKWDGSTVAPFCADFVLPRFDEEVDRRIHERRTAPYTDWPSLVARVLVIFQRVSSIRGAELFWA